MYKHDFMTNFTEKEIEITELTEDGGLIILNMTF
jgi:hypothetical protein